MPWLQICWLALFASWKDASTISANKPVFTLTNIHGGRGCSMFIDDKTKTKTFMRSWCSLVDLHRHQLGRTSPRSKYRAECSLWIPKWCPESTFRCKCSKFPSLADANVGTNAVREAIRGGSVGCLADGRHWDQIALFVARRLLPDRWCLARLCPITLE